MRKPEKRPRDEEAAPQSESGFSFTVARIAVAQICQSMGFKAAQKSALEALTDVATRYLKAIAKLAAASANSGGRTQSNLRDIIVALEDLATVQGFAGASTVRGRSLYTSAVIKDLIRFVRYSDEIPFARPLPPRGTFLRGKFLKCGENSSGNLHCDEGGLRHVPRWLPAVPVVVEAVVLDNGEKNKRRWEGLEEREDGEDWERKTVESVAANCNEIDISAKRVKVRFKMGSPPAIGSVGIRKRVWCDRFIDYQEKS